MAGVGAQRRADLAESARTQVGMGAIEVYRDVFAHQGPDGLLVQRALQRSPRFSGFSAFTKFWDPTVP
ncbi:MAG: hypothetical protein M0027_12530 [Candidatus Dormibacteraeota bacterium]|nr:hypothetical protein [Candidatus Dormibacteraeota bacterium]